MASSRAVKEACRLWSVSRGAGGEIKNIEEGRLSRFFRKRFGHLHLWNFYYDNVSEQQFLLATAINSSFPSHLPKGDTDKHSMRKLLFETISSSLACETRLKFPGGAKKTRKEN